MKKEDAIAIMLVLLWVAIVALLVRATADLDRSAVALESLARHFSP